MGDCVQRSVDVVFEYDATFTKDCGRKGALVGSDLKCSGNLKLDILYYFVILQNTQKSKH